MSEKKMISGGKGVALFLFLAFLISSILKVMTLRVGAPFVTIDDNTAFQGGFLVWLGNVPPQRMYLESWLNGLVSLATYVVRTLSGQSSTGLSANLVAEAYQDYFNGPDAYVHAYRMFVLVLDMATAWMVFRFGKLVLGGMWRGWAAAVAAVMFLFSYNTVWCDVVARPDVLVTAFSTLGLYFYYKSDFGERRGLFLLAAVSFGLAAGLKLHACLFVVFIVLDLLRVLGLRRSMRLGLPFVIVSGVFFLLSAGSPLFDPLLYAKLRMLNVKDDKSPWIKWGEQFYTMVRGSGWLVIPLVFWGVWQSLIRKREGARDRQSSVVFLAICWVILFATIRQLRAYWMLPALPLFYVGFIYAVATLRRRQFRWAVVVVVMVAMAVQTAQQVRSFREMDYGSLRTWIVRNIRSDEPFYVYGYEAVELPKTESCLAKTGAGLQRLIARDLAAGETHVVRHVKNWEERSTLALFDMLSGRSDRGFTYYSNFGAPLDKFEGILDLAEMQFIFVQEGIDPAKYGLPPGYLRDEFELETELTGPGGGGSGLGYQVYARKARP